MSEGQVWICFHCGTHNGAEKPRCWMCEQDKRVADAGSRSATQESPLQTGIDISLGWMASVGLLATVFLGVGLGILSQYPALIVPFGGVSLLVMGALTRMIQLQRRRKEPGKGDQAHLVDAVATVASGAVLGGMLVVSIIMALVMTFIAAMILLLLVCMADAEGWIDVLPNF